MPSQQFSNAQTQQTSTPQVSEDSQRAPMVSNAMRQDQLRSQGAGARGPVRANPTPWAAQARSVTFNNESNAGLFQNGATANDVVQGQNGSRYLGDCWLMASLASIASTQPQVLEQAITDHGDGTYTVRLHKQARDGSISAEDIVVTGAVPQTADGRDAYAQRQDPKELWVVVIEKAFASWKGGYGALDGGVPTDALTALTGRPSNTAFTRGNDSESIQKSLNEGHAAKRPMVAASGADFSLQDTGIVPAHAHSIMDVQERDGETYVTVRDPFAQYEPSGNGPKDGTFTLPLAEFQKRFQYFSWANTDSP